MLCAGCPEKPPMSCAACCASRARWIRWPSMQVCWPTSAAVAASGTMLPRFTTCHRGGCPAEPMPRHRRGQEPNMTLPTLYEIRSDYLEALEVLSDPELDMPPEAIADTLEGLEGQL